MKAKEFKSWSDFRSFCQKTRRSFRYVHSKEVRQFLEVVKSTSKNRAIVLTRGTKVWRAQLGYDLPKVEVEGRIIDGIHAPYKPERMKPLPDRAREGRANSKGISVLYAATKKSTAVCEVRPWVGAYVSLALLELSQDLKVVDCSQYPQLGNVFFPKEPPPEQREFFIWASIDAAFSEPVTSADDVADYVPTQILAELFKASGFDALQYNSSTGSGKNIAIFSPELANLVDCRLVKVDKTNVHFSEPLATARGTDWIE